MVDRKECFMANEEQEQKQMAINIDAKNNPVLYCDSFFVGSTEYGITFDFAQRVGPTNQQQVVARVGMSFDHARKIIEVIQDHLEKHER
jgi:hypothetical protein